MDAAAHGGQLASARVLVEQLCRTAPPGALRVFDADWGRLADLADAAATAAAGNDADTSGARGAVATVGSSACGIGGVAGSDGRSGGPSQVSPDAVPHAAGTCQHGRLDAGAANGWSTSSFGMPPADAAPDALASAAAGARGGLVERGALSAWSVQAPAHAALETLQV
eukprot:356827-Chlamydomonas_euryale.AAC.2